MNIKKLSIIVGLFFLTSIVSLSSEARIPNIQRGQIKKEPVPLPNVASDLMIDAEFFSSIGLTKSASKDGRNVWSGSNMDSIQQVFDIRWVFNSNKEALHYHKSKLVENSEEGQPIQDVIAIAGTQELHVYRESEKLENMITKMKLPTKHFCFLFVVGNVVAKVYISVNSILSVNDIVKIPEEAVRRMLAYQSK